MFDDGERITLKASEIEYCDEFSKWGGDIASSRYDVNVIMDSDKQITAEFKDGYSEVDACGASTCVFAAVLGYIGHLAFSQRRRYRKEIR